MFLIFSFGISLSYFIIYFFGRSRFLLEHTGSSSLTRDQTHAPALGAWSLNQWITGEFRNNTTKSPKGKDMRTLFFFFF